jgi:hypothetical protein
MSTMVRKEMTVTPPAHTDLMPSRNPPFVNGPGVFANAVRPLCDAVLDIADTHRRDCEAHDFEPAPGSIAAIEDAEVEDRERALGGAPAFEARQVGAMQLAAAEDCVRALVRLVVDDEPVIVADKVVARAAIEAAARAKWLLDPKLDRRTRIERDLTERLASLWDQRLLGPATEPDLSRRRDEILDQARRAGFVPMLPRKQAPHVGSPRPKATSVMIALFDHPEAGAEDENLGRLMQSFLSMFVHSSSGGLMSAVLQEHAVAIDAERTSAPLGNTSAMVNILTGVVGMAYLEAAEAHRRLMGWDVDGGWRKLSNNFLAMDLAMARRAGYRW